MGTFGVATSLRAGHTALPSLLPSFAQFGATDLAAGRLWQFLEEFDLAGVLVRCRYLLGVILQLQTQLVTWRIASGQHDESLDDLGSFRVGFSDHGNFRNGGMLHEHVLDLKRSDAVRRAGNHVIASGNEPEVAIRVRIGTIAGEVPPLMKALGRCRFRVPVFPEQTDRSFGIYANGDLAGLSHWHWRGVFAKDG